MKPMPRPVPIALAALTLTSMAASAPAVFRRMDAFRVQTVEVTGTHYLSPEAALALSGITDSTSVFDDTDDWADRLRSERLIADAEVHRRLPGTLRIEVTETEPVALVRTPELRPVDAYGRLLPISAAGADLDVPVLADATEINDDSAADERTVRLIRGLLTVRAYDAGLADDISEIAEAHGGGLRMVLREPENAELLLPDPPDAMTLQQVLLAFEHMRAEAPDAAGMTSYDRLTRIDARYEDELFVSTRPARAN